MCAGTGGGLMSDSLHTLRAAVSYVMLDHVPREVGDVVTCEVCVAVAPDGFQSLQEWPCHTARALATVWPMDAATRERWAWAECGQGWYPLLDRAAEEMAAIDPAALITRVRRKYGQLRIEWSEFDVDAATWDAVTEVVSGTERASQSVCDQCSRPSTLRPKVQGGLSPYQLTTSCAACQIAAAKECP